ncbi:MAG: PAS domain-containing protein, partial [Terrimicrobiaceae bacterium]|nr:PAS domain-containing protein [Terrimicrobiaceae bacterium]
MLETPAAALTASDILQQADFASIGTNDLTQYTMAAGRENPRGNDYFVENHPAVLRLIRIVVEEACDVPVGVCGELASELEAVPTLLKLGIRSRRMPIDLFFRTLANFRAKNAVGVVLSGTGLDGTLGLKQIKEAGGLTLAQDPSDAEYVSMPRSAIATGLVDVTMPAAGMPEKILAIRQFAEKLEIPGDGPEPEPPPPDASDALRQVLKFLRIRTGHDFTSYKRTNLLRRIARRLQVHELGDLSAYLNLLREEPEEVQSLLRDLLITVTNFFRDKEAFDALEKKVIPLLFANKKSGDTVRAWVCGCATGEEAYSVAILLDEFASNLPDPPKIQVFASDINGDAIRSAREGRYDETVEADISHARFQRYFVKRGNLCCITKDLREKVLFASHNVLRDPPFSKLDLVSCRNLLIYLNRETQERILELFAFALHSGGGLFLGSSESADHSPLLFSPISKKYRLYKCAGGGLQRPLHVVPVPAKWDLAKIPEEPAGHDQPLSFGALHWKIIEQYAPPSILANEDYDILHASENSGRFLRFTGGEPSRNLLKLAHPALQLDLRATLMAAKHEGRQAISRHIQLQLDDGRRSVNLVVRPVELPEPARRFFLVLFEEDKQVPREALPPDTTPSDPAMETMVRRLEDELQDTRDRLRATIEQGETSTEELKASNEELQAINEELRSTTEELETGKEELQSLNEELTTVNNELKEKVEELSRVNSDLQNLMHSTDIGTVFLDRALRIKRYTPPVAQLFNIISSDIGRPFEHLTHKLDYRDLAQDAAGVLQTLRVVEREVHEGARNSTYLARISPYRTVDDRIDGVTLSFVEITELKRATDTLRDREMMLRMAQDAAKCGVWTLFLKTGAAWWSDECYKVRGTEPGSMEMTMKNWIHRFHPNDGERVETAMREAVENRSEYGLEMKITLPSGETRWLLEAGRAIYDEQGEATQISGITLDISERIEGREELARHLAQRVQDAETLKQADARKNEFLAILAHELRNPLAAIQTALELVHTKGGENRGDALCVIDRQVAQIVHLVDDLMDISRITQGKITLQKSRFDLAQAIRFAMETNRPRVEEL